MAANKVIPAFVLGAVVGGAIAYIGFANPPGDALTGAVAPAERYRAEQPSADDIQLGDQELQAVLQTDEFARLVADESFQKAMSNEGIRQAFARLPLFDWERQPELVPPLMQSLE